MWCEEIFFKEIFKEIKKVAKITGALLHVEEEKKSIYEDDVLLDQIEPDQGTESILKPQTNLGEMHESSDEEAAAEDADATLIRTISRHRENQEYEDPEEEEMEDINEKEDDIIENETEKLRIEVQEQKEDEDDDEPVNDAFQS